MASQSKSATHAPIFSPIKSPIIAPAIVPTGPKTDPDKAPIAVPIPLPTRLPRFDRPFSSRVLSNNPPIPSLKANKAPNIGIFLIKPLPNFPILPNAPTPSLLVPTIPFINTLPRLVANINGKRASIDGMLANPINPPNNRPNKLSPLGFFQIRFNQLVCWFADFSWFLANFLKKLKRRLRQRCSLF